MTLEDLRTCQAYLREACAKRGRQDVPVTRMSFRVNFSEITGSARGAERPIGQGTPAQVVEDMRRFRHAAGLEAFQMNFNGCHNLKQLLDSMVLFMQDVKPLVEQ
jgi:hypothetical protein